MRSFIYISSIALALVGFAANGQAQMADQQASGSSNGDLAIAGHILEYGGAPDGSGHQLRERFCRDGRWGKFGGTVPLYGTYEIAETSVCVRRDDGSRLCRRIYRDGSNYKMDVVSGSGFPPHMEVRIYPDDGSCF